MIHLFNKHLLQTFKYPTYRDLLECNFCDYNLIIEIRRDIKGKGKYETEDYVITEHEKVIENFSPLTVPCDYELPEKIYAPTIATSSEMKGILEQLGAGPTSLRVDHKWGDSLTIGTLTTEHSVHTVHFKIVLGGYCAHINVFNGDKMVASATLNKQLYDDWEANKIFCFKKYYTHGDEVLTTMNHNVYCAHVVEWEKSLDVLSDKNFGDEHCAHDMRNILGSNDANSEKPVGKMCIMCGKLRFDDEKAV